MATKKKAVKRRPCPSCGLPFSKGRIVLRLVAHSGVRQRVCQACAALAVPVLASDAQTRCEVCGDNLARICKGCVTEAFESATGLRMLDASTARRKKRLKP